MLLYSLVMAFAAGFALDWAWGWYMSAVARGLAVRAAVASVCCALPSLLGVTLVVRGGGAEATAYVAGLFFGTLVYIKVSQQ